MGLRVTARSLNSEGVGGREVVVGSKGWEAYGDWVVVRWTILEAFLGSKVAASFSNLEGDGGRRVLGSSGSSVLVMSARLEVVTIVLGKELIMSVEKMIEI